MAPKTQGWTGDRKRKQTDDWRQNDWSKGKDNDWKKTRYDNVICLRNSGEKGAVEWKKAEIEEGYCYKKMRTGLCSQNQ